MADRLPPPLRCQFCVVLIVEAALCLADSQPVPGEAGLHSTLCAWTPLFAGGVGKVSFTVLGLEPGEHRLTFVLKTQRGHKDVVEKKLRVVVRAPGAKLRPPAAPLTLIG